MKLIRPPRLPHGDIAIETKRLSESDELEASRLKIYEPPKWLEGYARTSENGAGALDKEIPPATRLPIEPIFAALLQLSEPEPFLWDLYHAPIEIMMSSVVMRRSPSLSVPNWLDLSGTISSAPV